MEVKILGTVSPYSKGIHNCPGYLVSGNNNKILLDCGNGITRLMNMEQDLKNLTIIISHLHKDHYGELLAIGYASYVYKKLGCIQERIPVYIPKDNTTDYLFLNDFGNEHFLEFIYYDETSKININDIKINFSLNPHQIKTYSIKVENNSESLVYSSDTGYKNNSLEIFAKGVNLFICESTFLKGQAKELDYHLYAYEAALIAKNAGVYKLLLTHFWPEIDAQNYVDEASYIFSNVEAAKENKIYKLTK